MKSLRLFLFLFIISANAFSQDLSVYDLRCEHKKNPIGVDVLQPRLSWKIQGSGNDLKQTAYSIRVASDRNFTASGTLWKSGKVASDESVLVSYKGTAPVPSQTYFWQVKVWDNRGKESEWSEVSTWETGLLSPAGWKADWIELQTDTDRYSPSPHFRKEFSISKKVKWARVYVTSHGFYELHLNGKKVGDQVLTPGWTSYSKRLQYQVYDVTQMLQTGANAIGAVLGDGWYRGTLAWGGNWAVYGKRLGLLLQLRVLYTDGTGSVILTDTSWKGLRDGAIRMNDIYNGETYDATKKLTGWDLPNYDDKKWSAVTKGDYSMNNIIASEGAPVRKIQEIKPVKIFKTPGGSLVADMGQNMVGWIRLKLKGPKGSIVIIRHAEVLDKYGEFYTENLRGAKAQLTYTMGGADEEVYEPRFSFFGFRFIEVTGFPGTLTPDNITGVVIHSDMQPTGTFECSNLLLNQLQHNIIWGQKGNFVDVPTDCPQRDERLGWTGDAQAFCRL
jgi:alpha-L-rhamnosidase